MEFYIMLGVFIMFAVGAAIILTANAASAVKHMINRNIRRSKKLRDNAFMYWTTFRVSERTDLHYLCPVCYNDEDYPGRYCKHCGTRLKRKEYE
mgnify:CR=1 FL=1